MTIAPERPVVGCPSRRPHQGVAADDRPALADGVHLLGEYAGTGYVEPQYLAARGTSQVQLSKLLHLVAEECDGNRSFDEIASRVSQAFGKTVSADNVRTLVDDKLRPLGILAAADGSSPDIPEADPLLALKLKRQVLHPDTVNRLASVVRPVFWPPVVALALLALFAVDGWLFFVHGLGQGLRATVQQPAVFLLVAAVVVVAAGLHEFGHAAACKYGGARPGGMGAGIYLVWPAFYTDVTNAYELDRRGRLRTDLGGVYVNGLCVLALFGLHAATGFEPLVLLMFLLQVQVLQQMLPFLRLDGYYVVSDLVGVPDLFKRIGPVLRSAIPFHRREPEVEKLKPWVRRAVTAWVLTIVPILAVNLGFVLLAFPRIVATSWDGASRLVGQLSTQSGASQAWAGVQLLLLSLPAIGITYTMTRATRAASAGAWRWSAGSSPRRLSVLAAGLLVVGGLVLAWWPDGRVTPYRPGEKGTFQQQMSQLQTVGQGAPLLRSPQQAQQPLPLMRTGTSGSTSASTSQPSTQAPASSTSTGPSPATTSAPVASSSPSPAANVPSSEPSATPTAGATPSPTTSP